MSTSNKGAGVDTRLQSVTNALFIDGNNDVVMRTGFAGNIIISGSVNIPGTIHVDSTPQDPVHVHVTEIPAIDLSATTLAALEHISIDNFPSSFTANQGTAGASAWKVDIGSNGVVGLAAGTTVGVTGTFWQATQPVSIASMPTTPVTGTVSVNNFPATQYVTGVVSISNFPSTQAVTGTVTANQGTSPWTVSGSVSISSLPEVEVKNDSGNPLSISKNTSVNSTTNRIYVSQETDVVLADSNYELNLARGLVTGQYLEMKNGYAPSVGGTEVTVWGLNTAYPWASWTGTGSRLWVGSSSASDTGQTVYIDGLDSNFARINETVTLNGTTYVQTTAIFYRVNRMYQLTGTANVGNISARITSSSGTQVYYMLAGNARGKNGVFTVPAGYTAYILYGDASSYKNGSGNVSGQVDMYTRTNVNGTVTPFMNQFVAVVANGQYRNDFNVPLRIPEKTDIDVRFTASGNGTTVSVNWEMIMIPN